MKFLASIFDKVTKAAVKVALVVVMMFAQSFFIRAQESTERIYYRFDNAVIDASYMSNSQAFANIDSLLESGSAEGFEIVSYSSPEGDFNYNLNLSTRRAEALRKYLTGRYPQLAGKISINPNAESWNALRASVEADSRLSGTAKASMLQIIDSNESADTKEKKLAGLQSWRYLYANYFRSLRYAEIRFVGGVIEGKAAADTVSAAFSRNGLQGNAEETVSAAATNASQAGAAAAQSVVSNNADNLIFGLRSATIESEAHNNAAVLASIAGMISGRDIDEIESINIISTASPEGPEAINNRYSMQRGQALRDYIVSEYPALAGKITVHSAGEAWEDLRLAVESDATISDASRSNILSIIVSNSAADAKEAKLRSLPEWNHLFEDVFPGLRCARLDVEFGEAPSEPVMPVTEPAEITEPKTTVEPEIPAIADQPAPEVEDEPLAVNDSTLVLKDTTLAIPSVAPAVAPATVAAIEYVPALAVSTNLLLDAATAVNVSVAVPVGNNWSIRAEYTNPWWIFDNNRRALQIQHLSFGARYYPSGSILGLNFGSRSNKRVLTGWYLEGMFGTGKYDIEPYRKGWQGEEWLLQLGGGYSFQLGKHWSLDLGVDFGSMQTGYRYYESNKNDTRLIYKYSGLYSWMGPTNVRASLTYLFYCKSRKGNAKKEVGDE